MPPKNTISDFWKYVDKSKDCWLWVGGTNTRGYGTFMIQLKPWLAHRFSWTITKGAIPEGLFVCHKCDNPPCVNPDHLFLGTNTDNMRDMVAKGRHPYPVGDAHHRHQHPEQASRGEKNGSARLTEAKVKEIRELAKQGWQCRQIAARMGNGKSTVGYILQGKYWRHVT